MCVGGGGGSGAGRKRGRKEGEQFSISNQTFSPVKYILKS